MNDHKQEHEKLKELTSLHHNAITTMLRLIREKAEAETEFWNCLKKELQQGLEDGKQKR